jgi:hypothetical protein
MAHDARARLLWGIAALLPCALAAPWQPAAFMAAWLAPWWFWMGLALGAQVILWMQHLTGGAWIGPIDAPLRRMRMTVPLLALLLLPLLSWPGTLYPWASDAWVDTAKETGFRAIWLTHGAMAATLLACAAAWIWLSRRRGTHDAGRAALGLLVFGYTVSVAAVATLASLTPRWYSSAFGLVVLVAQSKAAMSRAVLAGAGAADPDQRNDLGNLLLMYVLTWAYLSFTQFQIIWAENLPAEIAWYVPRLQTAWVWLGVALVVLGFAVPLPLLLARRFKRDARCLRGLAGLLLITSGMETAWWVYPSLASVGIHVLWMLPLVTLGMGCLCSAVAAWPRWSATSQGGRHA